MLVVVTEIVILIKYNLVIGQRCYNLAGYCRKLFTV